MYYNFTNDLAVGRKYEEVAKEILKDEFGELNFCANKTCDLENEFVSFEVKTDFISKNTDRIGVEFKDRGKLSGLASTTADYYFIIAYDKSWSEIYKGIKRLGWWIGLLIETPVLKELCRLPQYKKVDGGDEDKASMILVPVAQVREHTNKIYPITYGVLT